MKLWYSFLKELKLASKSFYFYMELIMAVIIIVILTTVVPENFTTKSTEYVYLDLSPDHQEKFISDFTTSEEVVKTEVIKSISGVKYKATKFESSEQKVFLFETKEGLEKASEKDGVMGIAVSIKNGALFFDYYIQGYESEKFLNIMKSASVLIEDQEGFMTSLSTMKVKSLDENHDQLTDRENLLPLFLFFNGSLMGLFIVASYIFLDKGEGVIKAYAITTSSVKTYLLSKVLVLSVTSIITSFAVTFAVVGFDANYLGLFLLIATSGFFISMIGLILSSYYTNIMQSFGVLYVLIILLSLPVIAYNLPAWNPGWIQWIPTYYVMYGIKEILLENGDFMFVIYSSLGFLALSLVMLPIADFRFKKTLV